MGGSGLPTVSLHYAGTDLITFLTSGTFVWWVAGLVAAILAALLLMAHRTGASRSVSPGSGLSLRTGNEQDPPRGWHPRTRPPRRQTGAGQRSRANVSPRHTDRG